MVNSQSVSQNHVVFFSGGASSYACAKRLVEKHGSKNITLLFTDTNTEEPMLYKFILEASKKLGCELVMIDNNGETIWDIAFRQKMLFNSRIANCTKILKIKSAEKYIKDNFSPENTILYLGLDWAEQNRHEAPRNNWKPYQVEYPMNEEPYLFKEDYLNMIEDDGLPLLESYKLGFEHGNCGGFCFKAGIGHFVHLLKTKPDYFYYNAEKEKKLQEVIKEHRKITLPIRINKEKNSKKRRKLIKTFNSIDRVDLTILTRLVNKRVVTLSLYELAELYAKSDTSILKTHLRYRNQLMNNFSEKEEQKELTQDELFSFGGCGCFSAG